MKQSDIFSIIIIATAGTLASYFAVNAILGNPDDATAVITTINPISPNLEEPDSELFNPEAINPTVEVMIDGCKDLDHNGIIDYAELVACGKIEAETPQQQDNTEGQLHTCSDGSLVTDESQCSENQKQEQEQQNEQQNEQQDQQDQQEGSITCPDGKRATSLADC